MASALWCCFYGVGIIGMLVIYGLLQERIMTIGYNGDMFTSSVFLVFCNRMVAVVFAVVMIIIKGEAFTPQAPLYTYLLVSFSNVGATTCQYEALKYVSFPVQMLGKSFKMMPVMVWGIIISQKSYKLTDWLVALAVTGGVTEFLMTGDISSPNEQGSSMHGLLLLCAFLALDGFTSTAQEYLFHSYKTSKYNQMLYINTASALVSLVSLLITRTLLSSIAFCGVHPWFVVDAMSLSFAAVGGQFFIYSMVKEFGALVFAATMNVRQVVSILISYVTYGHPITALQILGLTIVFSALFYKSYLGFTSKGESKGEKSEKGETDPLIAKKADEENPSETNPSIPKQATPAS